MIVIDGQQSVLETSQYKNLEQVLVKIMDEEQCRDRIITDVLVNDESFTEIYPHQAEDVDTGEIDKIEVITVPKKEMAINITRELYKVIRLMNEGARQVSDLFRQAEDAEALEVYQDLLEVIRDFLGMVGLLRDEFGLKNNEMINQSMEDLSSLLSEFIEVQENEDWVLLSDLLEYELNPLVARWKEILSQMRHELRDKRTAGNV